MANSHDSNEPVAWSVTCNGSHCGNVFFIEQHAKEHKARLDADYPEDKRSIVPLYTAPQPAQQPPQFPTMLRKMWSGAEVQQWINEHWDAAREKNA